MGGGGADTVGGIRARAGRGGPNWWVILAVSLALMALLVATSGLHHAPRHSGTAGSALQSAVGRAAGSAQEQRHTRAPTTTSTTSAAPKASTSTTTTEPPGPAPLATRAIGAARPAAGPATDTTATTTTQPTTTTTAASTSVASDRNQSQGVLDPPLTTSNQFVFTGTGTMEVSVLWSGDTYLTMEVSCPNGVQNVGGTDAMEATLSGASGSCTATVSEPSSESATLTYSISIGPSSG